LKDMDVPDEARLSEWQAGVEDATRRLSRLKGKLTRLEHKLDTSTSSSGGKV